MISQTSQNQTNQMVDKDVYRRVSARIGMMCDGVCPRISIVQKYFSDDDVALKAWVSDYCKMPDHYIGKDPTPDSIISCAEAMAMSHDN